VVSLWECMMSIYIFMFSLWAAQVPQVSLFHSFCERVKSGSQCSRSRDGGGQEIQPLELIPNLVFSLVSLSSSVPSVLQTRSPSSHSHALPFSENRPPVFRCGEAGRGEGIQGPNCFFYVCVGGIGSWRLNLGPHTN
jgi:hypothetical protein